MILVWLGPWAAGETWSVADAALEGPLRAALTEAWPQRRDVEMRVGAPDGADLVWDGQRVTWAGADGQIRSAPADDPAVVVLLARTWTLAAPPGAAPTFLPARAPPPPPPVRPPPPPPPPAPTWRWSVGIGARAWVEQPRLLDGVRGVGQIAAPSGRVAAEPAIGVGPTPNAWLPPTDGGAIDRVWADRLTLGVAAVGVVPVAGGLGVRGAVGPEIRWTEHWLYADGQRWSATRLVRTGVTGTAGLSARFGRWELVMVGIARVSTGDGPRADGGVEVDLRVRPGR